MRRYFHKTCSFIVAMSLMASFLGGCSPLQEPESEPVRISLDEAQTLIRAALLAEDPDLDPEVAFTLEERTTDELWQRMGAQIFLVGGSLAEFRSAETHLIIDKQVHRLGMAFGGYGVTSMAVADLDQDQQPELFYTYSWGSGLHRAHLAVYLPQQAGASMGAEPVYLNEDLILEKVDDRTLLVKVAHYDPEQDGFVESVLLGQVRFDERNGVTIELEEGLPPLVMERLILP